MYSKINCSWIKYQYFSKQRVPFLLIVSTFHTRFYVDFVYFVVILLLSSHSVLPERLCFVAYYLLGRMYVLDAIKSFHCFFFQCFGYERIFFFWLYFDILKTLSKIFLVTSHSLVKTERKWTKIYLKSLVSDFIAKILRRLDYNRGGLQSGIIRFI